MKYNKPKLIAPASPIKAIQGFDKVWPMWWLDATTIPPSYAVFTPAAYSSDE